MPKIEKYFKKLSYSYSLGIFPSVEALTHRPEYCEKLLLSEDVRGEGVTLLLDLCKQHHIRVEYADKAIQKISDKKNIKVAAVFRKYFQELEETGDHIVLHNIMDAGNLGTILRTALGFSVRNIAIIKPATDVFEPSTIRASMGAFFQLNVKEYPSLQAYIDEHHGRNIYPFMLEGRETLQSFDWSRHCKDKPATLMFGNEGSGLPKECFQLGTAIRIQHSDTIDSLNLANAVAIALFKLTEERYR